MELMIHNVRKSFGDKNAVNGLTVELTKGVYGFLGANGSGKTTLMRMIATVMKPSEGKILLNGKDIFEMDEEYRDLLGYLPQHIGYYKNFSAEKFLHYIAALKGIDKKETKNRVNELISLVGLEEVKKKKIKTYSGGMKQRVGIAQALLNDPKILILDEPTAGLDPKERIRLRNLLSEIANERIVLLSTHIVSDIEFIAKELLIMKNGQLVEKGTIERLLKELEGKVWTTLIEQKELPYYQNKFKVSNILRKEEKIELKIISKKRPSEESINSIPNLEDLYLYHFDIKAGEL